MCVWLPAGPDSVQPGGGPVRVRAGEPGAALQSVPLPAVPARAALSHPAAVGRPQVFLRHQDQVSTFTAYN